MNLHAQWIIGFIDGKGFFNIHTRKNIQEIYGIEIISEFVVVLPQKDIQVLYALKSYFGCGVVKNNSFVIKNRKHLYDKIIPFFEKHKLLTKKRIDFEKFRFVVKFMIEKKHFTDKIDQDLENLKDFKDLGELKKCLLYFENANK